MKAERVKSSFKPKYIFILILISSNWRPITSATFENVQVILKWRSGIQDKKIVTVHSDDYLRSYVGEFGEIIIENQNVRKLVENSVSNLPKATHLHLTDCGIEKIEPGAFRNLPALSDLNLSGNLLVEIENGLFENLNFRSLYLENNRISRIGDKAFNNLKMGYLFIDDNRISEWKSEWFRGTPLRSISMRNNLLTTLPRLAFEYLWHFPTDVCLENFILTNNQLKQIDPDSFKGVKIIYSLDLQNNSLTNLEPGSFDYVEAIDHIDLSGNQIANIYYEVFRKTKITQLNIFDNYITCVPTEIFNVTELEILNADKNPVSCDCVHMWTKWKKTNRRPEINQFSKFQARCKRSKGATPVLSPLVPFLIFFLNKLQ